MKFEDDMLNLVPTGLLQTRRAVRKLIEHGIRSYDDLINVASGASDPELQSAACELLGFGRSTWPIEESVAALRKALDSNNNYVRYRATVALGKIRSGRASEDLINIAESREEELFLRIAAIQSLEYIGGIDAAADLLQLATELTESEDIRILSLEVVGHLQYKDAVPTIMQLLDSLSVRIRFYAVFALGLLGDKRAVSRLYKIVEEDSGALEDGRTIKQEALEAVSNIKRRRYS